MKKAGFVCILALTSFLLSCGKSPLLNHSNASDTDTAEAIAQQTKGANSECPIIFTKEGLCASLTWTSTPVIKKKQAGSFTVKFWDKLTGSALNGPFKNPSHSFDAVLWMPSMGHGSWITSVASTETGIFNVSNVFFIMPGDWEIQLQLYSGSREDDDKKNIHEQVKLSLPAIKN